jgi:hypothetical protein
MATILHESFKQQQQQKEKEKDKDLVRRSFLTLSRRSSIFRPTKNLFRTLLYIQHTFLFCLNTPLTDIEHHNEISNHFENIIDTFQ